jgi:hypothetical protein
MSKRTRWLFIVAAPLAIACAAQACKHPDDDDDDGKKPAPSAAVSTPQPPQTVSVEPQIVDAGPPPSDAPDDADAPDAKKVGSGDASGIRVCCAALRQNAKSAPPESQGAYLLAAGACDTMAKTGTLKLAQLRGMLLGAGLPATCK